MKPRTWLWSGLGALGLLGALGGAWILSLPSATVNGEAPPIGQQEVDAILAALKPPTRQRPVIAIIGINDATEATDYLMSFLLSVLVAPVRTLVRVRELRLRRLLHCLRRKSRDAVVLTTVERLRSITGRTATRGFRAV